MEKELTIVSAFFNINRKDWAGFERTEDTYFDYFQGWAKLKNRIIVYVENQKIAEKIIDFRRGIGLEDKTIVNIVDNIIDLDNELYNSISAATNSKIGKLYRLYPNNPEVWNVDYDYVMLLKMWCVKDAVQRGQTGDMVAWVDFGYNHGGDVIDSSSDFNYLWKYDFPDKINLFYVQELDDRPILDIVALMDTYIMGTVIVGAASLWNEFWELMRSQMIALNDCGLTDDDQNIILMSFRKKPELFNLIKSDWQLPLWQCGGNHMKLRKNYKKESVLRKIGHNLKKLYTDMNYVFKLYKHVRKVKAH